MVRLSLPMMWGIFAVISYQLVDMYFIGRLGTRELAAFTFTFPVTMLVFHLIMGLSIATSSVISRQIGQRDENGVRRLVSHAILTAIAVGVVLAVAGGLTIEPVFRLMGAKEDMLPMIRDYMLWWFLGGIFITVPMVANAAMRASGDAMTPAFIMTLVAVVNIVLDPLLIFGLAGLPRLEIAGAAIATVIANACAMIVGLYILWKKKKLLFHSPLELRSVGDSLTRLMHIALPSGLSNTITPLTHAIIVALLARFGTEAVAAYGIVSRVEGLALIVLMGTAIGMSPIIGQNWGAGRFDRVHETLKKGLGFFVVWSLFVAALLAVFGRDVSALFSDNDEVTRIAALYFLLIPASWALGTLINGWSSAFNAMGLPRRALAMVTVRMLVLQAPLAVAGAHFLGVTGVFIAIAATNIIAGGGFHILNLRISRRQESPAAA